MGFELATLWLTTGDSSLNSGGGRPRGKREEGRLFSGSQKTWPIRSGLAHPLWHRGPRRILPPAGQQAVAWTLLRGPFLSLAAGRDVEHLAVLGHGAPGHWIAAFVQFVDEAFVGKGIVLVLFLDERQQFLLDRFPGNFLAGHRVGTASEEALEGKDPSWRLHPLLIDGPRLADQALAHPQRARPRRPRVYPEYPSPPPQQCHLSRPDSLPPRGAPRRAWRHRGPSHLAAGAGAARGPAPPPARAAAGRRFTHQAVALWRLMKLTTAAERSV